MTRYSKLGLLTVALIAILGLLAEAVDARRNYGSRGERTFRAPPTTNTAPKPAAPIEKSMTQPGKSTAAAQAQQAAPAAATQASRFGGWRSLLLGGLIGAGLASLFGLGAFANVLGFLLQAALIGGLIWLAFAFFRSRQAQPAMASAGASNGRAPNVNYRTAMKAAGGGAAGAALAIGPDDFDAFEKALGEIQMAYGRNDLEALGDRITPEMLSYFAQELDDHAKAGVRNEVSEPKLLQGDLAEAWREPGGEYATVAMRYSLIDAKVDTSSGRVTSGSKTDPQEFTELWTFRRPNEGNARQWELSAIQQS